ncbi:hypothetical protein DFR59_1054 [Falsibacillus pallidus]|uniref:Uncharacterized protein n=1 Tax=Falsibacillus pallidus TaxID=493781 RepID=A0A370GED0_9BACI|nr:hypothetical protein DFR59_1054 [Falsibacillus pallidus]
MPQKVRDIMKYRKISLVFLFLAISLSFINSFVGNRWMTIIGISFFAIFLFMTFTLWKCPICKTRLPLKFDKDKDLNDIYRCPYCDTKFIDGEIIE